MRSDEFHYALPRGVIAQQPAEPRDAARLLDTRDRSDHLFRDLPSLLRPHDLLVVNDSRVRAARLRGRKVPTGGMVEMLLLGELSDEHWQAVARPARKLRVGTRVSFGTLEAEVMEGPEEGRVIVRLAVEDGSVPEAIERVGELPLPPYIDEPPEDPESYQTVYARRVGSAAAPTAGLHFTQALMERVKGSGVSWAAVDLEVGPDTFRPLTIERLEDHPMHAERYRLSPETAAAVGAARQHGGRVIAVGTSAVRALEASSVGEGLVQAAEGKTDLFIQPGYRFQVVDGLITNFHLPRSTPLVLVAAVLGHQWKSIYATAIERGYRFLSFGDAMYADVSR